jgi:hypothetical protein
VKKTSVHKLANFPILIGKNHQTSTSLWVNISTPSSILWASAQGLDPSQPGRIDPAVLVIYKPEDFPASHGCLITTGKQGEFSNFGGIPRLEVATKCEVNQNVK